MGIKNISFIPYRTVPEAARPYPGIVLTGNVSVYPKVPVGTTVFAFHTSFNAWGKFTYLRSRKTQSWSGAPVGMSTNAILGAAGTAAMSANRVGVTMATVSASQYGWVQTAGINFKPIITDKGVAAGDMCFKDESTAKIIDTATNTGTQIGWAFIRALADDSTSYLAAGKAIIQHLV